MAPLLPRGLVLLIYCNLIQYLNIHGSLAASTIYIYYTEKTTVDKNSRNNNLYNVCLVLLTCVWISQTIVIIG